MGIDSVANLDALETRVLREVGRVGADSSGLAERHIGVAAKRHAHELRALFLQHQLRAS
jgi:hypothetical protein